MIGFICIHGFNPLMDYDKSAESNIVANLCDAEKKSAAGW